jgi:hypothetical protein
VGQLFEVPPTKHPAEHFHRNQVRTFRATGPGKNPQLKLFRSSTAENGYRDLRGEKGGTSQMLLAFASLGAIALLLSGLAFELDPNKGAKSYALKEALFVFIAFYFVLLGLRMMVGILSGDSSILLGDLFASLALTFFWAMKRK